MKRTTKFTAHNFVQVGDCILSKQVSLRFNMFRKFQESWKAARTHVVVVSTETWWRKTFLIFKWTFQIPAAHCRQRSATNASSTSSAWPRTVRPFAVARTRRESTLESLRTSIGLKRMFGNNLQIRFSNNLRILSKSCKNPCGLWSEEIKSIAKRYAELFLGRFDCNKLWET